jgi:hypothetical protein
MECLHYSVEGVGPSSISKGIQDFLPIGRRRRAANYLLPRAGVLPHAPSAADAAHLAVARADFNGGSSSEEWVDDRDLGRTKVAHVARDHR